MKNKLGQFEIIGLLVVVILVSLGVLFVVQFVVLDAPSTLRQSHTDSQFATSFLTSFLETSTEDCQDQQIKSLVHDCVKNLPGLRVECYDNGTIPPPDSCEYVNKTAYVILNRTLIRDNKAFMFFITDDVNVYSNISYDVKRCEDSLRIESKRVPLQIENRIVNLYMKLCQ